MMELLNKNNALKKAVNDVLNNKPLKESIIKFQNEVVSLTNSQPKTMAIVAPKDRTQSALMAKALADVYAANGEKTILLDLDLYAPTIATLYDLSKTRSILEISLDNTKKGIAKINDKLDVIASKPNTYPAKFLLLDEVKSVLDEIKKLYDHIIITLPPVLENSDILLFKDYLDAIILVVHKNQTKIKDVKLALEFVKNNNLPYVGTMFISKKGLI